MHAWNSMFGFNTDNDLALEGVVPRLALNVNNNSNFMAQTIAKRFSGESRLRSRACGLFCLFSKDRFFERTDGLADEMSHKTSTPSSLCLASNLCETVLVHMTNVQLPPFESRRRFLDFVSLRKVPLPARTSS